MSNSLQPYGLQHASLPWLSLSPGVCSNSCPWSQRCYLSISSSTALFSCCLQSCPASSKDVQSLSRAQLLATPWIAAYRFPKSRYQKIQGLINQACFLIYRWKSSLSVLNGGKGEKLNTWATWYEEPTHWKRPWCWQRLKAKEKRAAEDDMVKQCHLLTGHKFEQTSGNSERQGNLACCSPWGHKEPDMT